MPPKKKRSNENSPEPECKKTRIEIETEPQEKAEDETPAKSANNGAEEISVAKEISNDEPGKKRVRYYYYL
jgi:hypothetical protein